MVVQKSIYEMTTAQRMNCDQGPVLQNKDERYEHTGCGLEEPGLHLKMEWVGLRSALTCLGSDIPPHVENHFPNHFSPAF